MERKRLDLIELEEICTEFGIDNSWFDDQIGRSDGTLHVGNGVAVSDYIDGDDARKLIKLFEALPRLIEMAGIARSLGDGDGTGDARCRIGDIMYGSFVAEVKRGCGGFPWVARLTGLCTEYSFQREFIKGVVDYSSWRHPLVYFALPPGIYDTYDPGERYSRKFIYIDDNGDRFEWSRKEVEEWLTSARSESTS
jgi:hypothetical protein